MLQNAASIGMPDSRPMPSIGLRCHELHVRDESANWRIFYRIDSDRILFVEIHEKKTPTTPKRIIDLCKKRLRDHDSP
jgi:phage-related protein